MGGILQSENIRGSISTGGQIGGTVKSLGSVGGTVTKPQVVGGGAAPLIGEVTLLASAWVAAGDNLHSQIVSIEGVTRFSQVDLTPSVEQLAVFYDKSIAFVAENEDGVVTVYVIGQKPENDYTMQVTITEVLAYD